MAETKTPVRHDSKTTTALRRFAISITIFNIVGYTYLGFEQPWLWPFIALATAYTVEIVLEVIGARAEGRAPRFLGAGKRGFIEFLYPAHITALAVNMLSYVNDRVWVMMFGVTVAIAAKWILRAPVRGRLRHYMNPSNFGIAMILILFPWASIAPPYHFTEHTGAVGDWLIPAVIVISGTLLNAKLTNRMWLILAWLVAFALQAVVRGIFLDTAILGALGMMTSVAFVLFTNYMITDPGTSPSRPASQIAFGAGVAVLYGAYTGAGIAYGLFFATATVCLIRGLYLWALHISNKAREQREAAASGGTAGGPPAPVATGADPIASGPNSRKEAVPA
ncbi:RnfABCDGE type electron transport complex subunit D [Micromonospora deserti]|uniref:Enediyne biosynthesis protein n=1 Tax=Micromonospora deserti TaxID=2070366 RepID=A0A2W2CZ86_9ACTN|nr:RnfABCDGE type electron transport complex subunit D [Micromonospora deserti]PZF93709.1 enediyne biosynthesis protein [Micromonospora deserti]